MNMAKDRKSPPNKNIVHTVRFDPWLLMAVMAILIIGLTMVASASVEVSQSQFHHPFHFLFKQLIYMVLGVIMAGIITRIPLQILQKMAPALLILTIVLLILVLVPGIGRQINGSMRWIGLGPVGMQVSELAKIFMVIYMADYLYRRQAEVQTQVKGFLKPMFLLGIIALLLLKEPDFGATSVIIVTCLGMMFLAGVPFWQFMGLLTSVMLVMAGIAVSSPYRMARLTSFLNPWSNQFDSGYQLTQALIAFGRGGWFGTGLGDSIQKLYYLPESHTDFLFAIYSEEMGLLGVFLVMGLFTLLVGRGLSFARRAHRQQNLFAAFLGYGLCIWLAIQAMINMGVNSGLLPTKGLTLPLMSYGGSSMIVMLMVIGVLFRIDFETKDIDRK